MPQKAFLPYASKIINERLHFLHERGTTLKIVVKWRWLPRFFSTNMTLIHTRVLLILESLLLVSKGV